MTDEEFDLHLSLIADALRPVATGVHVAAGAGRYCYASRGRRGIEIFPEESSFRIEFWVAEDIFTDAMLHQPDDVIEHCRQWLMHGRLP